MFTLFRRKKAPFPTANPVQLVPKGLLLPESAAALLASSRRQKLLEHIWQRTSLSRAQFSLLYRAPLERYAALVQQLPASESHHHAYPGGMLDHGLEIVAYALKLRQSHLLPVGAPPESQAAQAEAWTAATAYAALLHDVGKIAVDLHVEYADGECWHPWHGPLAHPYRFRYRKDRSYRLHNAAAGLLYTDILDKHILDWLSEFPDLWASLLYVLAGQYEHAGVLGELVIQADQASVAQDLGGDPAKARMAPKQALQRKLVDGLRYLLKEELKLNQPQASDGWLTQDALWLVSKTVCDKLRAHLLSQGLDGIPDKNTAVFNVLQEHGIAQANPEGKAIWRATVASDSGWTQTFTFLKVAPTLIWDAGERPAAFAGSVNVEEIPIVENSEMPFAAADNSAPSLPAADFGATDTAPSRASRASDSIGDLLALIGEAHSTKSTIPVHGAGENAEDVCQPHTVASETKGSGALPHAADEPLGAQFVSWLRGGIQTRRLKINDARALIHTVAGTAYVVTPGAFQRFVQEHPEISYASRDKKLAEWEWVQKQFQKLHVHKKQPNGLNIWICEVTGPRKTRRLHGYLLSDPSTLFSETPFDNPYLKVLIPAIATNSTAA